MKIERLLAMVMLLLARSSIKADELAEQFEVSRRTIYRDVESLALAGLPVVTTRGPQGGIALLDSYKIKQKLFTTEEVGNLLTSLQAYDQLTKKRQTKSTLVKLLSLIEEGEIPENPIYLDLTMNQGNLELQPLVELFQTALARKQLVTFAYCDRVGQWSQRQVESYRLVFKESKWYLQGYCLTHQAFRIFKLGRMSQVSLLPNKFKARPFETLDMNERKWMDQHLVMATLKVNLLNKAHIVERFGANQLIGENEAYALVRYPVADNSFGYRKLLALGIDCEILSPLTLRQHFKAYLQELSAIYP